ncbi:dispersed gene family protein 1 (DGF-1), putative, partial [Trypanosoma cruzi]
MVDGASATHHESSVGNCLGRWMQSAVGACPRGWHCVLRMAIAAVLAALLVALALVAVRRGCPRCMRWCCDCGA